MSGTSGSFGYGSPPNQVASASKLKNFLQALEAVKNDFICGVCRELCKNPVTLSKCFHIICGEHFEDLTNCPHCNISLEGCTTFSDDRLVRAIAATKDLEETFTGLQKHPKSDDNTSKKTKQKENKTASASAKPDKVKASTADSEILKAPSTKSDILKGSSTKADRVKASSKESKDQRKSKSDTNASLLSNAKFNKAVEKRNIKGETRLHIACRLGYIDNVIELLNQGANMNSKDNAGWTPLHEVVQNGRLDLVKLLLQYNSLINVPGPSNETPLHEAVRYKHEDIVEELVKNGADINIRNCKGETPYELANVDMKNLILKASEHTIQTQSVNISHIAAIYYELESDDIHIYCTSRYRTVYNLLKQLAKSNNNVTVEMSFTKKVTHIIVDTEGDVCTSSVDVLQAVMSSLWVLSTEWVTNAADGKLEPFEKYEVRGIGKVTCQGPRNSRYNKYKQLPGLFDGCHFYFHNFTGKYEISKSLELTKAILAKLVTEAGGVVLRRVPNPELIPEQEELVPYHVQNGHKLFNCSHYIIFRDKYEPMYNMQHLKALPVAWLIDCMERYELCDP